MFLSHFLKIITLTKKPKSSRNTVFIVSLNNSILNVLYLIRNQRLIKLKFESRQLSVVQKKKSIFSNQLLYKQ